MTSYTLAYFGGFEGTDYSDELYRRLNGTPRTLITDEPTATWSYTPVEWDYAKDHIRIAVRFKLKGRGKNLAISQDAWLDDLIQSVWANSLRLISTHDTPRPGLADEDDSSSLFNFRGWFITSVYNAALKDLLSRRTVPRLPFKLLKLRDARDFYRKCRGGPEAVEQWFAKRFAKYIPHPRIVFAKDSFLLTGQDREAENLVAFALVDDCLRPHRFFRNDLIKSGTNHFANIQKEIYRRTASQPAILDRENAWECVQYHPVVSDAISLSISLRKAKEKLNSKQRETINACFVRGLNNQEAAEETHEKPGTFNTRRKRAVAQLADELRKILYPPYENLLCTCVMDLENLGKHYAEFKPKEWRRFLHRPARMRTTHQSFCVKIFTHS